MKVIVESGKIYDADLEPIILVLSEQDKKNIANMPPDAYQIIIYPDDLDEEEKEDIMNFWAKFVDEVP